MTDNEIRDRLAREVRIEDLRDAYPSAVEIINEIGVEAFVKMSIVSGGISLYVPKFENVIAAARNRLILQEFDGGNYAALARRYDITETWVRDIVNRKRIKENSVSLFEEPEEQAG